VDTGNHLAVLVTHEQLDAPEKLGLPATPFFYHLDQCAQFMQIPVENFISQYVWFLGRSTGVKSPRKLKAVNMQADADQAPDWRISEGELVRWMKLLGFKVYSRGRVV
jgi:hypothetical protein